MTYKPTERGYDAYQWGRKAGMDKAMTEQDCPYVRNSIEEVAWITGYHEAHKGD